MALAMTHEEVLADLTRREVHSYKQLPILVFHIQTKWRDEPRPRAGLIRVREFIMKDSYSLDATQDGLDDQYRAQYQAYFNIFRRCGLEVLAVKSDPGTMGGSLSHEFIYPTPIGEDTILVCNACGYHANQQIAQSRILAVGSDDLKQIEKVFTPACASIQNLADFLAISKNHTARAVFFIATLLEGGDLVEKFIFSVIRGDLDLNEAKLARVIHAIDLRPANEAEILSIGAVPGFASPINLPPGTRPGSASIVVVDGSITISPNLVAGANVQDYHLLNVNFPRDYKADIIADIACAKPGSACICCGEPLSGIRGIEVGNIFQLGTRYSDAVGCSYSDKDGKLKPIVMGSYGIGIGRLLACIAEEHHDIKGLIWPVTVAPYHVHMISLTYKNDDKIRVMADELHEKLTNAGIDVLYDDRHESPGIKFNDADLIGIPIRLTVSESALKRGGVELKLRNSSEESIVSADTIPAHVMSLLRRLDAGIQDNIKSVIYTV
jgi:prolyl-tRNA synthetase